MKTVWHIPSDQPVRAVALMAGCCYRLFGDRGTQAATMPTLILHGTADHYDTEAVYLYDHVGSEDRYMIDFIGAGHDLPVADKRIAPFLTAFFGYYLQGHEDYAQYLSEDYVSSIDGLAWGIYES